MFMPGFLALLNDPTAPHGTAEPVVRIAAAFGALIMTGVILFRQKTKPPASGDDAD